MAGVFTWEAGWQLSSVQDFFCLCNGLIGLKGLKGLNGLKGLKSLKGLKGWPLAMPSSAYITDQLNALKSLNCFKQFKWKTKSVGPVT